MSDQSIIFDTPRWLSIVWTVNGFLTIVSFIFGYYIVWMKSPKEMCQYKHFLAPMVFYSSFFDIGINLLMRPVVLFPMWGGFSDGGATSFVNKLFAALGIFDGDCTYILPLCQLLLNVAMVSLVCGFLFRYWALQQDSWALRSMNNIYRASAVVYLTTAFPGAILCAMARPSREDMIEYVLDVHPEFTHIINHSVWAIFDSGIGKNGNVWATVYGYSCVWTNFVYIVTGAVCIYYIVTKLNRMKGSMSEKTYKLHRSLLISLCFQAAVPIAVYFIPILFAVFAIAFGVKGHVQSMMHIACALMGTHSMMNVALMTYFTKPYREFVIEMLQKIPILKPKPTSNVKDLVSNARTSSGIV